MKANLAITHLLEDIANVAYFMDDFELGLRCVLRLYQYIISAKAHADEMCAKQTKVLMAYADKAIPDSKEEQIYRQAASSTSAARALYHQADQVSLLQREVQQAQQRLTIAYDDMMPAHDQPPKKVHWPDEDKLKSFSLLDPEAEEAILDDINTTRELNQAISTVVANTASLQADARHLIVFFEYILQVDQNEASIEEANKRIEAGISKIKQAIHENKQHHKPYNLLYEYRIQVLLKITTVIATVQSIYYQDGGCHWWRLRNVLSKMCADCKALSKPTGTDTPDQKTMTMLRRKTVSIKQDMLCLTGCTLTVTEGTMQLITIYERILKPNKQTDVVISEIEEAMIEHSKQCLDDEKKIRGYLTVVDALQCMRDLYHQGEYAWQLMLHQIREAHHSLCIDMAVGRVQALDTPPAVPISVASP